MRRIDKVLYDTLNTEHARIFLTAIDFEEMQCTTSVRATNVFKDRGWRTYGDINEQYQKYKKERLPNPSHFRDFLCDIKNCKSVTANQIYSYLKQKQFPVEL